MTTPKTLTQIAGAPQTPSPLAKSALLVIDLQNEYQTGALKLDQLDRALEQTRKLLKLARANGMPVFHFQHKTGPGAPIFDPTGPYFGLIKDVAPVAGETVIEKSYPNCFNGTGLEEQIKATGRTEVIIAGAMTHMCVSATARSAFAPPSSPTPALPARCLAATAKRSPPRRSTKPRLRKSPMAFRWW